MKLLLDQNLSHTLVHAFEPEFPGSVHVRDVGLDRASDRELWTFAKENDYAIVTKDSDFSHLSFLHGPPPKVIWLTVGNSSTRRIMQVLRDRLEAIRAFSGDSAAAILVLP